MKNYFFKNLLKGFRHTCLHPQWFVYKDNQKHHKEIGNNVAGRILDIGCADQFIQQHLLETTEYIGLDYYETATEWYHTKPNVFGDAQGLPFLGESIDSVLLLDVLEHIPDSNRCLSEIYRVLKREGTLVLQVPFIYPIHDAPLDFQRWTSYGLLNLVKKNGFVVKEEVVLGKAVETAGLLFNISLCKLMLNWLENRSPALIFSAVLAPMVVMINLICWILALVSPPDGFMSHGYRLILEKHSCDT